MREISDFIPNLFISVPFFLVPFLTFNHPFTHSCRFFSLPHFLFFFFYTPLSSSSHLPPRRSQRGRFFYSSIHHWCQAAMLASIQKQKPKGKRTIMRKKSREFKAGLGLWRFGNKQDEENDAESIKLLKQ